MEEEEEDDDEVRQDPIKRNQFDVGGATTMTDVFPETSVVQERPCKTKQDKSQIQIAPGEGKIPTDLMRDEHFDVNSFPHLFSNGKFGLNVNRKKKVSPQQTILCRLRHISGQFAGDPLFLFAMHYFIERLTLERNINISYQRGKIKDGIVENLHDVCSILDNVKGSGRYWLQQRYQVLAKLEQLGPFQFFFTLSCADKRWDENFVSILRQKGLKIIYEDVTQQNPGKYAYEAYKIFVQEEGKEKVLLKDYLEGEDLHEMVRKNVMAITMNFNRRVHAFMSKVVMSPSSPMKTKYYHYRVEFQLRGAGHIHGVLWVDVPELEKKYKNLETIMLNLRTSVRLDQEEKDTLSEFVDDFVSCSLSEKTLEKTVREVQMHGHCGNRMEKTGCFKKGPSCRFGFPRFPSEKTIIAQPLKITDKEFEGQDNPEKALKEEKKRLKSILDKVKMVLIELDEKDKKEEKEGRKGYLKTISIAYILKKAEVEINEYYKALGVSQNGACVILKRNPEEININNYNPEWLKAWDGNMDIAVCLDFFAIVTYITDYYTKSETRLMNTLSAAAKACKGKARKDQLKFMVIAMTFFLTIS